MIRKHVYLFFFTAVVMLLTDGQYLALRGEDIGLTSIRESIIAGQ